MLDQKSNHLTGFVATMCERRHTDGWKFPAVILSVLGLCSSASLAQAEDCWQSEFTKKTYTWQEFSSVTAGSPVTTPSGKSLTDVRAPRTEWIRVGGQNEFTKFYRVPCPPPPPTAAGGVYVQAGIGGGWSVPSSPGLPHGSGSGVTADASVGFRFSSRDLTSWGSLDAGVTYFGHGESFPAPADDLKVRPTVVFHQSASLGPNFQGFAPGQRFAPYLELGIAESPIKVRALVGSDRRWSVAPLIGGGIDYRINPNWLLHTNVRTFMFGDQKYQLGAGGPTYTISERATTATFGFIYQLGDAYK